MRRKERYLARNGSNISTCSVSTKKLLVKLRDEIFREDLRIGKTLSDPKSTDNRMHSISHERISSTKQPLNHFTGPQLYILDSGTNKLNSWKLLKNAKKIIHMFRLNTYKIARNILKTSVDYSYITNTITNSITHYSITHT